MKLNRPLTHKLVRKTEDAVENIQHFHCSLCHLSIVIPTLARYNRPWRGKALIIVSIKKNIYHQCVKRVTNYNNWSQMVGMLQWGQMTAYFSSQNASLSVKFYGLCTCTCTIEYERYGIVYVQFAVCTLQRVRKFTTRIFECVLFTRSLDCNIRGWYHSTDYAWTDKRSKTANLFSSS